MTKSVSHFAQFALPRPLIGALADVGYETPTPIQEQSIPILLKGQDLIGQAQTGTGKTAAFALPLLANIDIDNKQPQVVVLTPTRELAIQVSEAFQKYAHYLSGFHVLPIYGGQDYRQQLRAIKRGVHVICATPGRIVDHIKRGNLRLKTVQSVVLDEADEMLKMGFIDDVEWLLEQMPDRQQTALFSATMPKAIQKIAKKHLQSAKQITIEQATKTATSVKQSFWLVSGLHKLEALTRILECEVFDAMIIFVRTKNATVEIADKLEARGFSAAAINGDMPQSMREKTVEAIKNKKIDIIVATDVVARGLDIKRISHVVNYDVPYDTESYIHRIGRTGRAGREGQAILFVTPREKRLLKSIERTTNSTIEMMHLPSNKDINEQRIEKLKQNITATLTNANLDVYYQLIEEYQTHFDVEPLQIAAALAHMHKGNAFLLNSSGKKNSGRIDRKAKDHQFISHILDDEEQTHHAEKRKKKRKNLSDMETYRIQLGYKQQVSPKHIVGAIANEIQLESKYIGGIEIFDDYSLVELPCDMPSDLLEELQQVWLLGKKLDIKLFKSNKPAKQKQRRKRNKR